MYILIANTVAYISFDDFAMGAMNYSTKTRRTQQRGDLGMSPESRAEETPIRTPRDAV